jgi:hypothetical protein
MKQKGSVIILFLLGIFLSFACNMPGSGPKLPQSALTTAQSILPAIQPTLVSLPPSVITQVLPNLEVAATLAAQNAQDLPPANLPTGKGENPTLNGTNVPEQNKPGNPGKPAQTIVDFNTQSMAGQHRSNADYYDANLLERPFDSQMIYRGDVDIQKAEIFTDGLYDYFSIYLADFTNPKAKENKYGIDLDIDFDGRGDFLAWVGGNQTQTWQNTSVALYADADNDVGGKTPLNSDAPSAGNGYEKTISSSENPIIPDAIWARISPNNPNVVQIAVKKETINKPASFMWGVWADGGIKAPNMFDYNDVFTLASAGSPIKDDSHYPLKSLNTVDNTCRGVFGRAATGLEPGLCSDNITQPVKTLINPNLLKTPLSDLQKITPPPIKIP